MSNFSDAFLPALGASVAGIPGAVVATGLNVAGSMYAQKRAEENQRKINEQNRAWQLEDRTHDELYNSPAMQKARMQDAGIGGDYSQLVSPVATQSNTALGSAPANALGSLGTLGNTASASFASAMQTGMDFVSNSADYDLKMAQVKSIMLDAERKRIENEFLPSLKQIEVALGNSEKVKADLSIESQKIANFVADGLKDVTVQMGQIALDTAGVELENKRIIQTGLRLSNDLTTLEIGEKKYNLEEILPLKKDELLKTIQNLSDDHQKNIHEINLLGTAEKSALYQLFGERLQYLTDSATYDAIQKNYGKFCDSLDKKVKGDIRNRKYQSNFFNTGGFKDFNDFVEGEAKNTHTVAKTVLGALLLRGFSTY